MSIFIEMYCILLIISSIVFSAVDNNSLQFKKQSEMLKTLKENTVNSLKRLVCPIVSTLRLVLPLFFFNLRGTVVVVGRRETLCK